MNAKLWIMLAGAGVVGGAILLTSRKASASTLSTAGGVPTSIWQSQADAEARALAEARAMAGARAVSSNGAAGGASLLNSVLSGVNSKAASVAGTAANTLIPGMGNAVASISRTTGGFAAKATATVLNKAGSAAIKGIKKLKFW